MSVSQTHIGSTKQVVMLPFIAADITDASFTLNAVPPGTQWVEMKEYTMPYGGSILGFTANMNEALTGGTLQMTPTIDGTECATWTDKVLTIETPQYVYKTQEGRKSGYTFTAGQRLGLVAHKGGGTVAPTTADGAFTLIVLLENVQY